MSEFDFFYGSSLLLSIFLMVLLVVLYRKRDRIILKKGYRILIWNLLLSFFFLSIIFSVGETYYRFFVDTTDSFSINKTSQRWFKRHSKLNSSRNRDNVEYLNKIALDKKRRITIIGDSFSAGHGIKNVDDRFGNILREMYSDMEVHVYSNNGASSYSELHNLKKLSKNGYDLDIVLLVYCMNDIDYFVKETSAIYDRIHAFNNGLGVLSRNSYFINTLAFRFFALNDPDFMKYSDFVLNGYSGKIWQRQKEVLIDFKNFVQSKGAHLLVVTFPFLQQSSEKYSFRDVHEQLNKFWAKEGVPHLDLLDTYEPHMGSKLTVNKFDAHPNEFANELAAGAIDRFFRKLN